MDAALKAKWVDALRSGQYVQGKTYLFHRKTSAHCCLGVLCKVAGVSDSAIEEAVTTDISRWVGDVGISPDVCSILGDGMNDADGRSFSEIAEYIELNL